MEERRLEGGRLLEAGKLSQAEIARQLGISRAKVSDWAEEVESDSIRGLRKGTAEGTKHKECCYGNVKQGLKMLIQTANPKCAQCWTVALLVCETDLTSRSASFRQRAFLLGDAS